MIVSCPHCKQKVHSSDIDFTLLEIINEETEVIERYSTTCPDCGKTFIWDEVFIYTEVRVSASEGDAQEIYPW